MSFPSPPGPPAAPALQLRGVHKKLGGLEVLRSMDLSVHAGERVAIIGPNGAGKSTLFNLISGRMAPDGGSIALQGQPIEGKTPFAINRLGLARSFQISSLFPGLSVFDNLRCGLLWHSGQRYSWWRALGRLHEVNRRTQALLHALQLQHRRDVLAMHLSYAEQRALEMGVAAASGAPVLLLDEPTAGMSRDETAHCVALIRQLTAGRTLLIIEHDMEVVFSLADRIAVLAQGQVIAFDTPARVRAHPAVQQAYLGQLGASSNACDDAPAKEAHAAG